MEWVLEAAKATVRRMGVGYEAMFEIDHKDVYVKPYVPFHSSMEDESWKRYIEVAPPVLRIILCVEG